MENPKQPETPIEPVKTKEELFKEDPDNFIDLRKLVVAIIRTEKGFDLYFNAQTRGEMVKALGEVQVRLLEGIFEIDATIARRKVITAKGGIINAVRNRSIGGW